MSTLNKRFLVREAASYFDSGVNGTLVTILTLDLAAFHGYNYGNTGNRCTANLRVNLTGFFSSNAANDQMAGFWSMRIQRHNGTAPTVAVTAEAGNLNVALISFDVSGNTVRVRFDTSTATIGGGTNFNAILVEVTGTLIDYTK